VATGSVEAIGRSGDLERAGELEFVRDLMGAFLQDTAVRLESMRKAAAPADFEALATCSHALRGSALLVNANRLAELCREIEQHTLPGSAVH